MLKEFVTLSVVGALITPTALYAPGTAAQAEETEIRRHAPERKRAGRQERERERAHRHQHGRNAAQLERAEEDNSRGSILIYQAVCAGLYSFCKYHEQVLEKLPKTHPSYSRKLTVLNFNYGMIAGFTSHSIKLYFRLKHLTYALTSLGLGGLSAWYAWNSPEEDEWRTIAGTFAASEFILGTANLLQHLYLQTQAHGHQE